MKIPFKWYVKWFYFRWNIRHFFTLEKNYYVRISKKEKRPFVNITIYPLDESCRTYDPTRMLGQFMRKITDGPPTLTDISGFANGDGILSLRTNCSLVRNAN